MNASTLQDLPTATDHRAPPTASPEIEAGVPPMASRRVALRPLTESDRGFLYELMTDPRAGGRVRFGGATPSPDKVAASLWDSVLAQFVIVGRDSGAPLGLAALTSPRFRDGHCYLSALGHPRAQRTGLVAEGVFLTCNYAFLTWPLRKIYMESTEQSLAHFDGGLDILFTEEGRLREHAFWNGEYQDVSILAIYRETWARQAKRFARHFLPADAARDLEQRAR
ncbi:MAG: GNAT family protein [Acidobacteriota bacterium]